MRIEVRKTDTFTNGTGLCIYRGKLSASIRKTGLVEWTGIEKLEHEYDIPHDLAFELMTCMGHDPVYVDEAVPSPDPHAEWRESVTEWARTVSRHIGYRDVAVAFDRVMEAAERAKSVTGDGKGGAA